MPERPIIVNTANLDALNPQTTIIAEAMRQSISLLVDFAPLMGIELTDDPYQNQRRATLRKCAAATYSTLYHLSIHKKQFGISGLYRLKTTKAYDNSLVHIAGAAVVNPGGREEAWYAFSPANLSDREDDSYNRGRDIVTGSSLPRLISNLSLLEPDYFRRDHVLSMRPFRPSEDFFLND